MTVNNAMAGAGGVVGGNGAGLVRLVGLQSMVQAMEEQEEEQDHLQQLKMTNEPIIVMVMAPDGANDR